MQLQSSPYQKVVKHQFVKQQVLLLLALHLYNVHVLTLCLLTLYVGFRVKEQWMTSSGAAGDVAALSVVKPLAIYMCVCVCVCVCVCGHVLGHW